MNDFQIINKLGEGAYSTVFKVKRLVDGNIYALKKVKMLNLTEKEKMNSLNEVRILASVKNNFVISYKEAFFDENESCLGIVMEYADKGDLYQKICEFKKAAVFFEESDIWRIFIQILKGLKSLHDLKILHRDLKSANVFLFNDGSAKLGDLNVSKVARRGLGYTQTGTPYYASPEVWKDQPYDSKSDIWSLGCVLYEMITLRPPFRAENMEGLYNKVIKGQINKIPDRFSPDLAEIVKMLIQVAPENRPNCGKDISHINLIIDQILKNPIIQKRIEYFKSFTDDSNEDQALLQTIRVPKNLLFLSDKLPQSNYEKVSKKNHSFTKKAQNDLPEIGLRNNINQSSNNIPTSKTNENIASSYTHSQSDGKGHQLKKKSSNISNRGESLSNANEKLATIAENLKESTRQEREKSPKIVQKEVVLINSPNARGEYSEDSPASNVVINRKHLSPSRNKEVTELPQIKNLNKRENNNEYKKKPEKNTRNKVIPYINNEHISNIYKIYAPYMKYNKYSMEKKNPKANYLKNIDKYYDYYNVYKPKKNLVDVSGIQVVPNRKLSPLKKNLIGV